MIDDLMTIPCTVTPRTVAEEANEYNDEVLEDGTPFDTVCWKARVSGSENTGNSNVVEGDWHYYFPADTDLSLLDARATVSDPDGDFEMVADPWLARNSRSSRGEHVEAYGRRVA